MPKFPAPFDIPVARDALSRRPLVFADVGAAGGIDPFLRRFEGGERAVYVGFEPNPTEFAKLVARPGVRFFPYAISDQEGEADLFLNSTASSLERPQQNNPGRDPEAIKVPVRTLAALVADGTLPGLDALKVDVEGHDLHALRGAGACLASDVLLVKTEFSFQTRWTGSYFSDIDRLLTSNGLALFGLQYYSTTAGEMGSGDAVYLRSVESIIRSDATREFKRERVLKLIVLSHYLRNLYYAYVVARAAGDHGILSSEESASICGTLQQHFYLPGAFESASWLDPIVHFVFVIATLLAGRRGRDKSLPKSNRLDRYRILFFKTPRLARQRVTRGLESAYENYRHRMILTADGDTKS